MEHCRRALALAAELGSPYIETYALATLGRAQVQLGERAAARQSFERGLAISQELGRLSLAVEAQAELAGLALAEGDLAEALRRAEGVLGYLLTGTLDNSNAPALIFLNLYRVLTAAGDARATEVLRSGRSFLDGRSAQIADEDSRRAFREAVPHNAELLALSSALNSA